MHCIPLFLFISFLIEASSAISLFVDCSVSSSGNGSESSPFKTLPEIIPLSEHFSDFTVSLANNGKVCHYSWDTLEPLGLSKIRLDGQGARLNMTETLDSATLKSLSLFNLVIVGGKTQAALFSLNIKNIVKEIRVFNTSICNLSSALFKADLLDLLFLQNVSISRGSGGLILSSIYILETSFQNIKIEKLQTSFSLIAALWFIHKASFHQITISDSNFTGLGSLFLLNSVSQLNFSEVILKRVNGNGSLLEIQQGAGASGNEEDSQKIKVNSFTIGKGDWIPSTMKPKRRSLKSTSSLGNISSLEKGKPEKNQEELVFGNRSCSVTNLQFSDSNIGLLRSNHSSEDVLISNVSISNRISELGHSLIDCQGQKSTELGSIWVSNFTLSETTANGFPLFHFDSYSQVTISDLRIRDLVLDFSSLIELIPRISILNLESCANVSIDGLFLKNVEVLLTRSYQTSFLSFLVIKFIRNNVLRNVVIDNFTQSQTDSFQVHGVHLVTNIDIEMENITLKNSFFTVSSISHVSENSIMRPYAKKIKMKTINIHKNTYFFQNSAVSPKIDHFSPIAISYVGDLEISEFLCYQNVYSIPDQNLFSRTMKPFSCIAVSSSSSILIRLSAFLENMMRVQDDIGNQVYSPNLFGSSFFESGSVELDHVIFLKTDATGNQGTASASLIKANKRVTIQNCIFQENNSFQNSNLMIMFLGPGELFVSNCTFQESYTMKPSSSAISVFSPWMTFVTIVESKFINTKAVEEFSSYFHFIFPFGFFDIIIDHCYFYIECSGVLFFEFPANQFGILFSNNQVEGNSVEIYVRNHGSQFLFDMGFEDDYSKLRYLQTVNARGLVQNEKIYLDFGKIVLTNVTINMVWLLSVFHYNLFQIEFTNVTITNSVFYGSLINGKPSSIIGERVYLINSTIGTLYEFQDYDLFDDVIQNPSIEKLNYSTPGEQYPTKIQFNNSIFHNLTINVVFFNSKDASLTVNNSSFDGIASSNSSLFWLEDSFIQFTNSVIQNCSGINSALGFFNNSQGVFANTSIKDLQSENVCVFSLNSMIAFDSYISCLVETKEEKHELFGIQNYSNAFPCLMNKETTLAPGSTAQMSFFVYESINSPQAAIAICSNDSKHPQHILLPFTPWDESKISIKVYENNRERKPIGSIDLITNQTETSIKPEELNEIIGAYFAMSNASSLILVSRFSDMGIVGEWEVVESKCPIGFFLPKSSDGCVQCSLGSFSIPNISYTSNCMRCPYGAECIEGQIVAGEGIWRQNIFTPNLQRCINQRACLPENLHQPRNSSLLSNQYCRKEEGYYGYLCLGCDLKNRKGFGNFYPRAFSKCKLCSKDMRRLIQLFLGEYGFLLLTIVVFKATNPGKSKNLKSFPKVYAFPIVFFAFQMFIETLGLNTFAGPVENLFEEDGFSEFMWIKTNREQWGITIYDGFLSCFFIETAPDFILENFPMITFLICFFVSMALCFFYNFVRNRKQLWLWQLNDFIIFLNYFSTSAVGYCVRCLTPMIVSQNPVLIVAPLQFPLVEYGNPGHFLFTMVFSVAILLIYFIGPLIVLAHLIYLRRKKIAIASTSLTIPYNFFISFLHERAFYYTCLKIWFMRVLFVAILNFYQEWTSLREVQLEAISFFFLILNQNSSPYPLEILNKMDFYIVVLMMYLLLGFITMRSNIDNIFSTYNFRHELFEMGTTLFISLNLLANISFLVFLLYAAVKTLMRDFRVWRNTERQTKFRRAFVPIISQKTKVKSLLSFYETGSSSPSPLTPELSGRGKRRKEQAESLVSEAQKEKEGVSLTLDNSARPVY